jgi:hypothetical protein
MKEGASAGSEESRASSAEAPPLPMKDPPPYTPERITLLSGSSLTCSSQARGFRVLRRVPHAVQGFAWHHKALWTGWGALPGYPDWLIEE